MSTKYDIEEFRRRLIELRPMISSINWKDESYTDEKAYVTAVFSKIAYLVIPDYELKYHSAAKIIPCLMHSYLLAHKTSFEIEEVLRYSEVPFENVFIIPMRHVIVVGIVMNNVIMISLRGTVLTRLSDWATNLSTKKTLSYVNGEKVKFHTGFYLAVVSCIEQISAEINKINNKDIPIYIVGHSLGGAMAGILNAVNNSKFSSQYRYGQEIAVDMNVNSCFTFGMPRYGNSTIKKLKTPYHIFNENDIVPKLPPKLFHFVDVPNMYKIGNSNSVSKRKLFKGIRHHFIEHYIVLLEKKLFDN